MALCCPNFPGRFCCTVSLRTVFTTKLKFSFLCSLCGTSNQLDPCSHPRGYPYIRTVLKTSTKEKHMPTLLRPDSRRLNLDLNRNQASVQKLNYNFIPFNLIRPMWNEEERLLIRSKGSQSTNQASIRSSTMMMAQPGRSSRKRDQTPCFLALGNGHNYITPQVLPLDQDSHARKILIKRSQEGVLIQQNQRQPPTPLPQAIAYLVTKEQYSPLHKSW